MNVDATSRCRSRRVGNRHPSCTHRNLRAIDRHRQILRRHNRLALFVSKRLKRSLNAIGTIRHHVSDRLTAAMLQTWAHDRPDMNRRTRERYLNKGHNRCHGAGDIGRSHGAGDIGHRQTRCDDHNYLRQIPHSLGPPTVIAQTPKKASASIHLATALFPKNKLDQLSESLLRRWQKPAKPPLRTRPKGAAQREMRNGVLRRKTRRITSCPPHFSLSFPSARTANNLKYPEDGSVPCP